MPGLMFSRRRRGEMPACVCAREHVREEGRTARKRAEGVRVRGEGEERGPEGHLSISAGVKWAGCMRRIAPYGRSLINSERRRSSGASVHQPTTLKATAGVPHRRRAARAESPIRAATRSYVLIWSERGNGRCHLMENTEREIVREFRAERLPSRCLPLHRCPFPPSAFLSSAGFTCIYGSLSCGLWAFFQDKFQFFFLKSNL